MILLLLLLAFQKSDCSEFEVLCITHSVVRFNYLKFTFNSIDLCLILFFEVEKHPAADHLPRSPEHNGN